MSLLLAIDPGADTGYALFDDSPRGGLVACGLGDPRTNEAHRICDVASVYIERPRAYPGSRVDPNDLITLALNAGEWAGIYRSRRVDVFWKTPAEWKGSVPKRIHNQRVWAALTAAEKKIAVKALDVEARSAYAAGRPPAAMKFAGKSHNVVDSIGLGLYAVGRGV